MEDVTQYRFPWAAPGAPHDPHEVVLDPETVAAAIALLARAVRTVVRPAEEADDER
jgi:hypothetical protein